ncbi:tRNA epoxyqueuosine(34) reductase QueG [Paenibacillus sp. SYP-B3998]|uniref:tRNA epoxyqueuosine(34) reductase QueG n=1 Tax=Paenibacillus sp. SYP-B3998 TaxID=2678564 RepID=A0A6G4A0Q2_9BACL|nr:tRNA epoxyqueuosine(34) reductase QueG [Paenibacillus sp. SYP-B3998]NEW08066.1 tRNA epoxyqueuosine(34) reductase QueG [Paenibacillus sp. SYP-B3998]
MAVSIATGTDANWRTIKQEIVEAASSLGIDKIGFTTAEPFAELKHILLQHREKGYESGFEEPDIEKRVSPELSFDAPKSIISIAVAYPSKLPNPPRSEPGAYRGIISRASWGSDYHDVLRDRLSKLEAFIMERVPDARMQSMVDTGVLVDRAVAERAGIGWSGKNCAVITPEWGSWVYLGEIITNIPFLSDTSIMDQCGDCTICIDACPTEALVGPGQLNSSRCISFITQTKGYVEDTYKLKIGNRLYGCDTCQVVCPKNKGLNWTHQPELQPDPEKVKPLLIPLLTMTNKQFKEQYGRIAASWRGKKPIQRNAIIALGNFKDQTAVPTLSELLLTDPRPEIRETAAWALGRIGGEEAATGLGKALESEQEPAVMQAIRKAQDVHL